MEKGKEPKNRFYLRDFDTLKDISFSSNEVINLVLRKTIPVKSYVRKSGTERWILLGEIPEISKVLNKSLNSDGQNDLSKKLKTFAIPISAVTFFILPYYIIFQLGHKGLLHTNKKMNYIGWVSSEAENLKEQQANKKKRDELRKKTEVKYPDPIIMAKKVLKNYKNVILCDQDINKTRTGNRLKKDIFGYLKGASKKKGADPVFKAQKFSGDKILGYPGKIYVGHGSDLSTILVMLEIIREKNTVGFLVGASFCEHGWKKAEFENLEWWNQISPDEITYNDGNGDKTTVRSGARKKADLLIKNLSFQLDESKKEKLFNLSNFDKIMKKGSLFKKSKPGWEKKDNEVDLEIEAILNEDLLGSVFSKRQQENDYFYSFRDISFVSIEEKSSRNYKNKFISFQSGECPLIAFGGDLNTPFIQIKLGGFERETPWGNKITVGEKIIKLQPQIIKGQSQAENLKNKILKNCGQMAVKSEN